MPDGREHSAITTLLIIESAPLLYAFLPDVILPVLVGEAITFLVNPDLDVDNGSISMKFIQNILGPIGAGIWKLYWRPYAILMPHRTFLSHFPVVSTFIRFLYIGWPIWLTWPDLIWPTGFWVLAGASASDFHHWFIDMASKKF
jgi:uncharacterized metal-binding protein